jgi:catechol 2,3-dioxygenase-like lactoylglutathione lyase family enzyme
MANSPQQFTHGQIRCGTISVSDISRSLKQYQHFLGFEPIEQGNLSADLAQLWGLPKMTGAPYVVLQAKSAGPCLLRLIEAPAISDFKPATTFGWSAFEITVADVFALADKLKDSEFEVVGPPKLVDGFTSFIPMQVYGPDGEILFLNQVNHSDDDADLPLATCDVDQIFIVVLATPDRQASAQEYKARLQLDITATHTLRYSLLNRAFGLPAETKHTITMLQNGRTTFAQIDQCPEHGIPRTSHDGWLPPGNAMVSVCVDNTSEFEANEPNLGRPDGVVYQHHRTTLIRGMANECIELIEIN